MSSAKRVDKNGKRISLTSTSDFESRVASENLKPSKFSRLQQGRQENPDLQAADLSGSDDSDSDDAVEQLQYKVSTMM
jgi:hypothetical protein